MLKGYNHTKKAKQLNSKTKTNSLSSKTKLSTKRSIKKPYRYYIIATTSYSNLDSSINTKLDNNNSNIPKVIKTYYLSKKKISKTTLFS